MDRVAGVFGAEWVCAPTAGGRVSGLLYLLLAAISGCRPDVFLIDACVDDDEDGYSDPGWSCNSEDYPKGTTPPDCCLLIDCDDGDPNTYPGSAENEAEYSLCMTDADDDGYGDATPNAGVEAGADCNDSSAKAYPGAYDIFDDGIDQDCDGMDAVDLDGDGVSSVSDCDDLDPGVAIESEEVCDGVDNDCDGSTDEDAVDAVAYYVDVDGDGFGTEEIVLLCDPTDGGALNSGDCDDSDISTYPGAAELEDINPEACMTDFDGDGYGDNSPIGGVEAGTDCDDSDMARAPGIAEIYDLTDNDCDGVCDESIAASDILIITEFMADASEVADASSTTAGSLLHEWIEVYNPNDFKVATCGWILENDLVSLKMPELEIESGKYAVLAYDAEAMAELEVEVEQAYSEWSGLTADDEGANFELDDSSDSIAIRVADGETDVVISEVVFDLTTSEWSFITENYSAQLEPGEYVANWCGGMEEFASDAYGTYYGTPGLVNSACE